MKYFLEQCLHSVFAASKNIETEVFVVDNNSVDGSCAMVAEKFPQVHLIENKKNTGFAVANNQAIRISTGQYVLLLNPDTIVEEDTFEKVVSFMDSHVDAGGLGVKMIDGKGNYLPESKRGFPSPMVAFYKMFGLSRIFPRSRKFNQYYMGHLSADKIAEVDVLAGAFMLMRRETLDKVGLLDEDYFMYGEDIDLSYRIIKGGYKNYYYPETTIIHYKGESTKKGSVNYVRMFYNAMIIFARKHLSKKNASVFSLAINMAIYFRGALALVGRFLSKAIVPFVDALLMYLCLLFLAIRWPVAAFGVADYFPDNYYTVALPIYILVWIVSVFYAGGYESKASPMSIVKGIGAGALVILVAYALLPEDLRFSRAIIIFGTIANMFIVNIYRLMMHCFVPNLFCFNSSKKTNIAVVGSQSEADRVIGILNQSSLKYNYVGLVDLQSQMHERKAIGTIDQIADIVKVNKIDELIFCSKDMTTQQIIGLMLSLDSNEVHFKIAPPESLSIIGSNSIDTAGDLYTVDFNTIIKPQNRRNKRTLDVIVAILLLVFSPLIIWFTKPAKQLYINILNVFLGAKTWVGFDNNCPPNPYLPKLKKGVISQCMVQIGKNATNEQREKINLLYAKDYQIQTDIYLIFKGFRLLATSEIINKTK